MTRGGFAALEVVTAGEVPWAVNDFEDLVDGHVYMYKVPGRC